MTRQKLLEKSEFSIIDIKKGIFKPGKKNTVRDEHKLINTSLKKDI